MMLKEAASLSINKLLRFFNISSCKSWKTESSIPNEDNIRIICLFKKQGI